MHSLTKTLMPAVHKPGFPKWDRLVGGAGGSSGKQAKNGMKTTKSEFWGQHSRGDKPICIQWLQN